MKLISAMLVVKDINQSVDFYETVLGLKIISDFGANKTLSGGLALQTLDSYKQFIETDNIRFGGNNSEIYFEVDDFDDVEVADGSFEGDVYNLGMADGAVEVLLSDNLSDDVKATAQDAIDKIISGELEVERDYTMRQ